MESLREQFSQAEALSSIQRLGLYLEGALPKAHEQPDIRAARALGAVKG
jgi:hypothetical protein